MLRVGMVSVNTPHAPIYARLLWDPDAPGAPAEPYARITAICDEDRDRAAAFAREHQVAEVVGRPEDMIGRVDAVLIIEKDQRKHAAQAIPLLRAGLPTFINKPLADDMADANAIVACARETGTPMFSCSALRFDREIQALKERRQDLGPVRVAVSVGYRELVYYGVHPTEMLVAVLGTGVEWVENRTEGGDRDVVHVHYADGKTGLVLVLRDAARIFELRTYNERGQDHAVVADTSANPMFADETSAFLRMVRTGEVPVPVEETLEVTRILCAARESAKTGNRVFVRTLG
jgi:predicted dehydrogenase